MNDLLPQVHVHMYMCMLYLVIVNKTYTCTCTTCTCTCKVDKWMGRMDMNETNRQVGIVTYRNIFVFLYLVFNKEFRFSS